eukprot:m.37620 g.37620  ORF g.37620 m.37620 type:complete len:65 (-) comp14582_c0_seq1:731-925(-)
MTEKSSAENLCPQTIRRVAKEVGKLVSAPPEGIKLHVNDEDITDIQATITGPGDKKSRCKSSGT